MHELIVLSAKERARDRIAEEFEASFPYESERPTVIELEKIFDLQAYGLRFFPGDDPDMVLTHEDLSRNDDGSVTTGWKIGKRHTQVTLSLREETIFQEEKDGPRSIGKADPNSFILFYRVDDETEPIGVCLIEWDPTTNRQNFSDITDGDQELLPGKSCAATPTLAHFAAARADKSPEETSLFDPKQTAAEIRRLLEIPEQKDTRLLAGGMMSPEKTCDGQKTRILILGDPAIEAEIGDPRHEIDYWSYDKTTILPLKLQVGAIEINADFIMGGRDSSFVLNYPDTLFLDYPSFGQNHSVDCPQAGPGKIRTLLVYISRNLQGCKMTARYLNLPESGAAGKIFGKNDLLLGSESLIPPPSFLERLIDAAQKAHRQSSLAEPFLSALKSEPDHKHLWDIYLHWGGFDSFGTITRVVPVAKLPPNREIRARLNPQKKAITFFELEYDHQKKAQVPREQITLAYDKKTNWQVKRAVFNKATGTWQEKETLDAETVTGFWQVACLLLSESKRLKTENSSNS